MFACCAVDIQIQGLLPCQVPWNGLDKSALELESPSSHLHLPHVHLVHTLLALGDCVSTLLRLPVESLPHHPLRGLTHTCCWWDSKST